MSAPPPRPVACCIGPKRHEVSKRQWNRLETRGTQLGLFGTAVEIRVCPVCGADTQPIQMELNVHERAR